MICDVSPKMVLLLPQEYTKGIPLYCPCFYNLRDFVQFWPTFAFQVLNFQNPKFQIYVYFVKLWKKAQIVFSYFKLNLTLSGTLR